MHTCLFREIVCSYEIKGSNRDWLIVQYSAQEYEQNVIRNEFILLFSDCMSDKCDASGKTEQSKNVWKGRLERKNKVYSSAKAVSSEI